MIRLSPRPGLRGRGVAYPVNRFALILPIDQLRAGEWIACTENAEWMLERRGRSRDGGLLGFAVKREPAPFDDVQGHFFAHRGRQPNLN